MVRLLRFALLIGLLLVVPAAGAQDMTDIAFFIPFVPNIQFAPVYVGLDKGYFADNGVNLTTEYGDEPVGVDLIAANQRQFGFISGEQVVTARAQDRPVVMVYEWFQQFPVGVVAPVESNINSVADLAGRTVGIPGRFGASYSGFLALLAANDMTEADVELQEIGFNAPEIVCLGAVEAAVVYINNEPLQIRERAAQTDCGDVTDVVVLPVSAAADVVSNGIVTNEETIANQPELVWAITTAFDMALRDSINNPAETYLISESYIENLPLSDDLRAALETESADQATFMAENPDADRETLAAYREDLRARLHEQFAGADLLQFDVLLLTIELWDADTLGYSDLEAWDVTQATLQLMGFIDEPIDLEAAFTNAFLPEG
jgi:NitT/TauT family transport system substrate-binding protein